MDAISRFIAPLFPGIAARRIAAQGKLLAAKRYYDAINITDQRPRRGNNASADAVMDRAKTRLWEYARWLDENLDIATGILDDLVQNIVGCGAGIEPLARRGDGEPDTGLNQQLSDLWLEFWEAPEITGELSGSELERLVCRSWLRDGEVFAQHLSAAQAPYASRIPYALELLECDFVPFDLSDPANRIVHGVQKDGWNRPVGYYINRQHPGNVMPGSRFDTIYKPVEKIIHLKFARRLHQTRGVSIFHSVLTRLDDLKDYEESERIAARVAAALTAFIKKSSDLSDGLTTTNSDGSRSFEMTPGLIFDGLVPGEDVGVIDSKRPNPGLEVFRNAMLRAVAAGTSTRFSSIAKNYNGTYSAQRQELIEGSLGYRRLFDYLRARFYLPVWRRFISTVRLAGLVRIPAGINEFSLYHPEVRPPALIWLDPQKDLTAHKIAVECGFKSRHQVIRDMGGNPSEVDAQLSSDPLDVRPIGMEYQASANSGIDDKSDDEDGREAA